jgi:hypothetical protein
MKKERKRYMEYATTWQTHDSGQREDECRGLYDAAESCWDPLARRRAQQLRYRAGTGEDGCETDSRTEATTPSTSLGRKKLATASEETSGPSIFSRMSRFPPNLEAPLMCLPHEFGHSLARPKTYEFGSRDFESGVVHQLQNR